MSASDWAAKAKFMRDNGATHAEWTVDGELVKLVLSSGVPVGLVNASALPKPTTTIRTAAEPSSPRPPGPAASLARMHETMFAASRMRPRLPEPAPDSDAPRAVSAKKAAARGTQKAAKRSTRKS